MANLTAVLRKTIDGLPNATPQLRAKVYEKARSAITRQIQAANPPLEPHVAEARYRVLEDAIRETEAHYGGGDEDNAPPPAEEPAAPIAVRDEEPPPAPPPAPRPVERQPERAAFPRVTPTMRPAAPADTTLDVPPRGDQPAQAVEPARRFERDPAVAAPSAVSARAPSREAFGAGEDRVGEIGPAPLEEAPRRTAPPPPRAGTLRPARDEPRGEDGAPYSGLFAGIPEADLEGPRRAKRRSASSSGSRRPALVAGSALAVIAALGAAAFFYGDQIRDVLTGSGTSQVASVPAPTATTDGGEAPADTGGEAPATAAPPSGTVTDTAPAAPVTGGARPRQFTQRLLPDGNEVDEGPGTSVANAFEEGTDVAAASPAEPAPTTPESTPAPAAPTTSAPATPPATASNETVPVGQRAVFYEERATNREGSQQNGNVVWSLVSEPPADGQPAEPAIRGVVDVPQDNLKMTLTIRRNADATLPASHVIEIMFDTPADFPGGEVANVQRLALKPTEQARGEPLIGVAGKISPGFFIIALNDLPQAIQSNLGLLGREQWIDIPLAYESGQRALMSVEKGLPGERVFKQALDAWAAKT
ncbi:hypothetical protein [Aureimonas jatrophae]|uniref:CheA signal transduction histidine kinase n=1 Tax=Aureimonas jatrophae TaxID=1166073 RepID=A0A1H0CJQ0_9HYPH|nr:hypothetical protein [Aureimonas jatrophae]MBB3949264.1 hypothetical protein [Aureimonas jatrophae]SDN58096.1 hypothetical protein SAMN05192530_101339 [Aureimonas jatrophae]